MTSVWTAHRLDSVPGPSWCAWSSAEPTCKPYLVHGLKPAPQIKSQTCMLDKAYCPGSGSRVLDWVCYPSLCPRPMGALSGLPSWPHMCQIRTSSPTLHANLIQCTGHATWLWDLKICQWGSSDSTNCYCSPSAKFLDPDEEPLGPDGMALWSGSGPWAGGWAPLC